jgi:pimeloyl-ACP methyl ester carboxylesterase
MFSKKKKSRISFLINFDIILKKKHILADLIPNSQINIFSNCAHVHFVEEPKLVSNAIIEFLI